MTFNFNISVVGKWGLPPRLIFTERSLSHHSAPKRTLQGFKVQYQLADDMAVNFTLTGSDEWGNLTSSGLGTPEIGTISDPTILKAEVQPDNSITITPLGKIGTSQVVVNSTVGGKVLTGTIDVTVVPGTTVTINFVPGATTHIDAATSPANPAPTGGGTAPTA